MIRSEDCIIIESNGVCRNPFYSGLLFDSAYDRGCRNAVSRNPFYSGLLFDSKKRKKRLKKFGALVAIPSIQVCCLILLIPRRAFKFLPKVAIPSIQVCCLIRPHTLGICLSGKDSRNPFYSGLLFDSLVRVRRKVTLICRNPFYSGLLFDSEIDDALWEKGAKSRNPFYSGLLFDSRYLYS